MQAAGDAQMATAMQSPNRRIGRSLNGKGKKDEDTGNGRGEEGTGNGKEDEDARSTGSAVVVTTTEQELQDYGASWTFLEQLNTR